MKTSSDFSQNTGHPVFRFFKEIMSVTIGLSLALGIENYSSLTQNRNLESYYLSEIKNDLRTDNDKIKEIINYNQVRTYYLNQIAFANVSQDSFLKCASYLRTVPIDYESLKPNFEALKSSSYFNIISNKDLLNSIIGHYGFMKRFDTQKHDLDEHFTHTIIPYLENNFDLWDFFIMDQYNFIPRSDIKKIMKDIKFKNLCLTHTEAVHLQTKILRTYLSLSMELIKKLETEIEARF